jgi:hypothetical protein
MKRKRVHSEVIVIRDPRELIIGDGDEDRPRPKKRRKKSTKPHKNEVEVSYPQLLRDLADPKGSTFGDKKTNGNFMCAFEFIRKDKGVISLQSLINYCKRVNNTFDLNNSFYLQFSQKRRVRVECRGKNISIFLNKILPNIEKYRKLELVKCSKLMVPNQSFFSILIVKKLNRLIRKSKLTQDEINMVGGAWLKKKKEVYNFRAIIKSKLKQFKFYRYMIKGNWRYTQMELTPSYAKRRWLTLFFCSPVDSFNAEKEFISKIGEENDDSFSKFDLTIRRKEQYSVVTSDFPNVELTTTGGRRRRKNDEVLVQSRTTSEDFYDPEPKPNNQETPPPPPLPYPLNFGSQIRPKVDENDLLFAKHIGSETTDAFIRRSPISFETKRYIPREFYVDDNNEIKEEKMVGFSVNPNDLLFTSQ